MELDTTDYTNKAPYLQEQIEEPQVTFNESYYYELKETEKAFKGLKKAIKEYFEEVDHPTDLWNDIKEYRKMRANINKFLKP